MNLPLLLPGAALLFWGVATGFPLVGAVLGAAIESARLLRFRWEATDEDLNRLWNFCVLILVGAAVFAFTTNDGPAAFSRMAADPSIGSQRAAGESSQRTAASVIRWMPMILFPFVAGQAVSGRNTVKPAVFALLARRRKRERDVTASTGVEIHPGWIYFGITLVAACINTREGHAFYAGISVLLMWALWARRARRVPWPAWVVMALAACALGYAGQRQFNDLRQFLEGYTPQWMLRWTGRRMNPNESRTAIGQIGEIKQSAAIVMRLEPRDNSATPALLRAASYRYYGPSGVWTAQAGGERSQDAFGIIPPEEGSQTWILRHTSAAHRFHLQMYLDGGEDALPLPLGVTRLENLPAIDVKTNSLGTVIAEGPGVVLFDVVHGFKGSMVLPPREADITAIPEKEKAGLDRFIAEMNLDGLSTRQKLEAVSSHFQSHFQYRLWQRTRFDTNIAATPLAAFLTGTNRGGHCEYFATATTLALRRLGIPARYAVGWAVQESSGRGYVIRERHAHAWCLAHFEGQWHDFDTTPASWFAEENRRASAFQFLTDAWSWVKFEFAKLRAGQSRLRDYVWWIVGPMLAFLLYRLVRRRPGGRARRKASVPGGTMPSYPGLDSEFYLVEKRLAGFGFIRGPGETLGQLLERALRDSRISGQRETLLALLAAHYRLRFDPPGLPPPERDTLRRGVRGMLESLRA